MKFKVGDFVRFDSNHIGIGIHFPDIDVNKVYKVYHVYSNPTIIDIGTTKNLLGWSQNHFIRANSHIIRQRLGIK